MAAPTAGRDLSQLLGNSPMTQQQGRDLSALLSAAVKPKFKAIDPRKEAEREQAKAAGKTNPFASLLLGASDLGAGALQGATYVSDGFNGLVNKAIGTNLDTKNYDRFTANRKDVEDYHNLRRSENGQGIDGYRVAGQIAATAPMAGAAKGLQGGGSALAAWTKFLGQNAALGAGISGAMFAKDGKQRAINTAVGGVGGAVGAAAGVGIGKAATAAKRAIRPTGLTGTQADITLTINTTINDALKESGKTIDDIPNAILVDMQNQVKQAMQKGKIISPEALERMVTIRSQGMTPLKAQVTGRAQDWQKMEELSKIQGAGDNIRDALVGQNKQLSELIDGEAAKTGGAAVDRYAATKSATDALVTKNTENKAFVSSLYNAAKNANGNNLKLDAPGFTSDAISALERDYAMSAMPKGIGTLLKDIQKNPDGFTLGKSEELIKVLNREYKTSIVNGQPTSATHAIGIVRDALKTRQEQAVSAALAANPNNEAASIWQAARLAHKTNAQRIESLPLLQAALKGKDPSKAMFSAHVVNGDPVKLKATVDELSRTNPQALADIQQQTLEMIRDKAILQSGQFSPAGMKRGIDAITPRRLEILFGKEQAAKVMDIQRAGHYLVTQPNRSAVNNSNTGAALVNFLQGGLNIPGLRILTLPVKDVVNSVSARAATKSTIESGGSVALSGAEKEFINKMAKAGVVITPQMLRPEQPRK